MLCVALSSVMWSWRSATLVYPDSHSRSTPHNELQPPQPAEEFRSFDEKTATARRCEDFREHLQERLAFEIDVSPRVAHGGVEICMTEPVTDGGEVYS